MLFKMVEHMQARDEKVTYFLDLLLSLLIFIWFFQQLMVEDVERPVNDVFRIAWFVTLLANLVSLKQKL